MLIQCPTAEGIYKFGAPCTIMCYTMSCSICYEKLYSVIDCTVLCALLIEC